MSVHHSYHHYYEPAKRPPQCRITGKPHKLHVIACISNTKRYKSRYSLYKQFEAEMIANPDVVLWTIEVAYGDRPFEITSSDNPRHVQFRTPYELWHKENMINACKHHIRRHEPNAEYVAWIDTDVRFQRTDWAIETMHMLQHHAVVQMWSQAIDLGPKGEFMSTHYSFMHQYKNKKPYCYGSKKAAYNQQWHPGYAWAMRVEAWDLLGGLLETAIMGAGDNHMAHALVGMLDMTTDKGLHPNYYAHLKRWADRAERYVRRNVGYVEGLIVHYFHGKKRDRRYHDRWQILVKHQVDPDRDLYKDGQGLWQLMDHGDVRSIQIRDDMADYYAQRNEDSIDLD